MFWRWRYASLQLNTKIVPPWAQFLCPGASPPLLCTSLEAQHKNAPCSGCLSCTPCRQTHKTHIMTCVLRVLEVGIPIPPPEHKNRHDFRVWVPPHPSSAPPLKPSMKMCLHGRVFMLGASPAASPAPTAAKHVKCGHLFCV